MNCSTSSRSLVWLPFAVAAALMPALTCSQQAAVQPGVNPEINGVVSETGTAQPVSGATVSLYFVGDERPVVRYGVGSLERVSKTQTDANGTFVFYPAKFGIYTVSAEATGFRAGTRDKGTFEAVVSHDEPSAEAHLSLSRPGQITGAWVDADTGKPLPGRLVAAQQITSISGRTHTLTTTSRTDADGQFTFNNVDAGQFLVRLSPQSSGKRRVITEVSEAEVKAIDADYEETFWPGGGEFDGGVPIVVASGASVDVGKINARSVPYYRAHITIPPGTCSAGDSLVIYERIPGSAATLPRTIANGRAACSASLLVAGLRPGLHNLTVEVDGGTVRKGAAINTFVVKDENAEFTSAPGLEVEVTGTIAAAEGSKPLDLKKIQVALIPLSVLPVGDAVAPHISDVSGKLHWASVPLGDAHLEISNIEVGHYVKEVRYGGQRRYDDVLTIGSASDESFTIVIDDKPGIVAGQVVEGEKKVKAALVLLVRLPVPPPDIPLEPISVTCDDQGSFQLSSVPPGEYVILALRSKEAERDRAAGALERALTSAKKIKIEPQGTIDLELVPIELQQHR